MFENSVGQCFVHQVILNIALNTFTNKISRVPCMLQTNICIYIDGILIQYYKFKNTYVAFLTTKIEIKYSACNYGGGCNGN